MTKSSCVALTILLSLFLFTLSGCGTETGTDGDTDGDTTVDGDDSEQEAVADGDEDPVPDGDIECVDMDFVASGYCEDNTAYNSGLGTGMDGCGEIYWDHQDCGEKVCVVDEETNMASCETVDGDVDIDIDDDVENEVECDAIELDCVSYCDQNTAVNCIGKTDIYGCPYHQWTHDDCGDKTCVEHFDQNTATCENIDGDLDVDTEVECEAVPSNCVSHCDNNVAKVCTPATDTNGCPYNSWEETDCLDKVCVEDFDNDIATCETADGDEEVEEDVEAPVCSSTLSLTCDNNFIHSILSNQQQDLIDTYSCASSLTLDSPEVIYTFSTNNECSVEITLTNLSYDHSLFRLSACDGSYCEDSSTNEGNTSESLSFNTLPGEEHLIAVDASGTTFTNYTIDVNCVCLVDGDEEIEEEEEVDVDGETLELSAISGLTPYFDFDAYDDDFFGSPWPNDFYKNSSGKLIMDDFPIPSFTENYEGALLMMLYKNISETMDGFGNNTAVYWTFSEAIDTSTLPQSADSSMDFSSSVLLVNIDPDSDYYNDLTPVEWHWTPSATGTFEPVGNLLAVAPYDGFPLEPYTTYAMILTDGVTDTDSNPLGRTEQMADLYSARGTGDIKLDNAYAPFAVWLAANSGMLDQSRVRAVTVFTTQNPVEETKRMADYIKAEYPDGELSGALASCAYSHSETGYVCFEGTYTSPNFQSGTKPYDLLTGTSGGGFKFDINNDPIEQESENIDFSLCVPSDASVPTGGWPLVMYSHGTGGDEESFMNNGPYNTADLLLGEKMAVIGIPQPLHSTRGDNYNAMQLEMYSFNYTNPESARATLRQSVMDTVALNSFIKAGKLVISESSCTSWPTSAVYSGPNSITFDTDNILFFGHSQGGLTGSMAAAVEPDIKGWVLSGAGGRMGITVMERSDPDILALLASYNIIETQDAYKHHPLIMIVQLITEITDPINYAPYWVAKPFNNIARSVMVTTGFNDSQTPKNSTYAMSIAGRVPQIEPETPPLDEVVEGLTLRNISSFARNASNTVQGPNTQYKTCGLLQYPSDGHFAVFNNSDAAYMYQEFLRSIAYTGVGVLGY